MESAVRDIPPSESVEWPTLGTRVQFGVGEQMHSGVVTQIVSVGDLRSFDIESDGSTHVVSPRQVVGYDNYQENIEQRNSL